MSWEQIKDYKIGRVWSRDELQQCFVAVLGGVALPDKQPGFAVVAGLRPVRERGENYRIHILAEFESYDSRELLRRCAGFSESYNIRSRENESFQWVGDGKNTALQAIVNEIHEDRRSSRSGSADESRDRLLIVNTAILLDATAYQFMVPTLKSYRDPKREQVTLHGSTLEERLHQIGEAEDLTELRLGAYPAIEALAFVVQELRHKADVILGELEHPSGNYERDWNALDV